MKKTYILQLVTAFLLFSHAVFSQCLNQSVTPVSASVICAGSGTIIMASSELGMNYYVRNDATNSVVTGPVAGTGGSLVLGTGHMSASTIYNIYGTKATGALSFDGVDDYVAIGSAFNSNADFTWEFWIKTGADGTIFSKSDATGNWSTGAKSLYIQNGKIRFEVFGIAYFETYNVYSDNNWHHVAVTAEMSYLGTPDDRVRIYVDGAFSIEKNNWDINGNSETGLINKIGYTNSNYPAASAFNGIIDDVKIWNAAHTATDVALDMTSCLTGSETGLVGYYRFEDGSGTTATDMAGNDNPGTLTNMASTAWVYGRDE